MLSSALFFAIAAMSSCTKEQSEAKETEPMTLRKEAEERQLSVTWAKPLGEQDSTEGTLNGGTQSTENSTAPLTLEDAAMSNQSGRVIYPYIEGFGSLDNRGITTELRQVLDGFCAALNAQDDITPFMEEGMEHLPLFFTSDLKTSLHSQSGDAPLFEKTLYAKPFFGGDSITVPVRFIKGELHTDIEVCLENKEASHKIIQLCVRGNYE